VPALLHCNFRLAAVGLLTGLFATLGLSSARAQAAEGAPAASPPAAETANAPEPMEEPQTGDRWTYEVRDDITGELKSTITNTVTDTSGTEISVRATQLGSPNIGYLTYDRSWNLTNNGVWRHKPGDGTGVRTPLAVGKTWTFSGSDSNTTAGATWKRSGTAKILAQESITTRAGTFDTFKIETTIQMQNANDPTKKVQSVQESWYAPAIDHWVKRTSVTRSDGRVRDKSAIELVEYGRRH